MPCTHCGQEPGTGYVTQDKLQERLAAKNTRIQTLEGQVTEHTDKANRFDALQANYTALEAETKQLRGTAAAYKAGFTNEDGLPFARLAHEQAMKGKNKADVVEFGEWLASDEAKGHAALKTYYAAAAPPPAAPPPAAPPPAGQPPAAAPPAQPPNPDAGTAQPPAAFTMTPDQLGAYFDSPEFLALTPEQQEAKTNELEAQFNASQNGQTAVRSFP